VFGIRTDRIGGGCEQLFAGFFTDFKE